MSLLMSNDNVSRNGKRGIRQQQHSKGLDFSKIERRIDIF